MKKNNKEIIIYQNSNGGIELCGDEKNETIWATQANIARLFKKDKSAISRHISSIFKEPGVDVKSNVQKMHDANSDKLSVFMIDR